MNKGKILKKIAPVAVSAIALSVLYNTSSLAGANTIAWNEIKLGDVITLAPGYYEGETNIVIPSVEQVIGRGEIDINNLIDNGAVAGVENVSANVYAGGNNDSTGVNADNTPLDISLSSTGDTVINAGVGESVTLPSGYYFNPVTVNNGVAYRGGTDIILTDTEKTKTFPAGYYDEFKVTGDFKDIPNASLTYTHHVHSLTSTSESLENETSERESINAQYLDDYQSTTSSGCFTSPLYYIPAYNTSEPIYCYGAEHPRWSSVTNMNECPVCTDGFHGTERKYKGQRTKPIPAHWSSINENNMATVINYTRSCGYSSGEVTDTHIHYERENHG